MDGSPEFSPENGMVLFERSCANAPTSRVGPKMIRFPPSPGDHLAAPTTKSAHLLRLTRYPQPHPRFPENRRRSTCGFVFAFFGMVGGKGINVVDEPISWRPFLPCAQKCRHGEGRRLRGGWGVGGVGLCSGSPPTARGLLAPGAASVPSAYGYPRPGLRRRPWQ